jgi:hypothetical protein
MMLTKSGHSSKKQMKQMKQHNQRGASTRKHYGQQHEIVMHDTPSITAMCPMKMEGNQCANQISKRAW